MHIIAGTLERAQRSAEKMLHERSAVHTLRDHKKIIPSPSSLQFLL